MKKIIILAFLAAVSVIGITQANQHTGSYTVQIGTYKNLPSNFVRSAEIYGSVRTSQAGELSRVSVGNFGSRSAAQDLLSQLRQAGYEDAFINRIDSNSTNNHYQSRSSTHHPSPSSAMAKFRNLSASEKDRAVFIDGKLHLKEGDKFIPVP